MKRLIIGSVLCSLLGTGCAEKEPFNASLPPQDLYAQCETLQNKKKHDNAVNCFETLKSRYPGTAEAALANLKIGDVHFQKKEYLVAAETYRSFIKLYPAHSRLDYAYYRAGLSYLKESPKAIDRNQEYLDDAIRYFEIILKYYPQSKFYPINKEQWEEARRRVASRAYYVGRFYYRGGEYLAAIPRFTEVYQEYPGLGIDEKALYYLALSHLKLNQKLAALEVYQILAGRFSESRYAERLAGKLDI